MEVRTRDPGQALQVQHLYRTQYTVQAEALGEPHGVAHSRNSYSKKAKGSIFSPRQDLARGMLKGYNTFLDNLHKYV